MSKKERAWLSALSRIAAGELSRRQAAELLQVSERQVYRRYHRYQALGDRGLLHRSRGGHSGRGHRLETRRKVVLMYRSGYSDYGPTLYSEALAQEHGLRIDHETLRRWLSDAGVWTRESPGHRNRSKRRRYRVRRSEIGAMVQLDGSPHDWFEGRAEEATLLVMIDDATGRVQLRFAPSEDTQGVFLLMKEYFERYGIPQSVYTDHGSVYWTEGGTTQFERAMKELGIETIRAHSPQAKGRVERVNRTLQDRLIKAMRKEKIDSIEAANQFLQQHYMEQHNQRFAIMAGQQDVHRSPLEYKIEQILAIEETRTLRNDYTISIANELWQIDPPEVQDTYLMPSPGAQIIVRSYLDYSFHAFVAGRELRIHKVIDSTRKKAGRQRTRIQDHQWRKRVVNISTPLLLLLILCVI